MDTSQFRPSTNVEDVTQKPLWQQAFENVFQMSAPTFHQMLQHPLTPYRKIEEANLPPPSTPSASPTDLGLPNTEEALKTIPKAGGKGQPYDYTGSLPLGYYLTPQGEGQ